MRLSKIFKSIFAFVLSIVMIMQCSPVSVYAENSDVEVSFSLTEVSGAAKTLELGMNIKTANDEKFKSAAAVLEFDNTVLSLIPWDTYVEYATAAAGDWNAALPIGTKGIDEYMTSSAQAYSVGDKTYLYVNAEAITAESLETAKQVVTVRFAYKDGKSSADVVSGETIKLAEDNAVVFNSPVQNGVLYGNDESFYCYKPMKEEEDGTISEDTDVSDTLLLAAPTFGEVTPGDSIAQGGSSMDGAVSIAFYDWDETLLGVLAVGSGEDCSERVNDYVKQFIYPELNGDANPSLMQSFERRDTYRGKHPSVYGDDSTVDLSGSGYPLTNKLDYVFYKGDVTSEAYDGFYFTHGWIPVTAATLDSRTGVFTAYSSVEDAAAANPVDFSQGLSESIIVKAAYVPGTDLKTGTGDVTEAYYTITDWAYNRYGSASYSVKATVERINPEGYGVPKLRAPSYRISILPDLSGAEEIMLKVNLSGKDEATEEAVVPKGVKEVGFGLINASSENWVSEAGKMNVSTVPKTGDEGFLILCTVKALSDAAGDLYNEVMDNNAFLNVFDSGTMADLGVTNSNLQGSTFTRNKITCSKFKLAYVATCGNMDLAFFRGFIANKDITAVTLNTDAGYQTALERVQRAVEANGGNPLTAQQTIDAINTEG